VEEQAKGERASKEERREYYDARRVCGSLDNSSGGDAAQADADVKLALRTTRPLPAIVLSDAWDPSVVDPS